MGSLRVQFNPAIPGVKSDLYGFIGGSEYFLLSLPDSDMSGVVDVGVAFAYEGFVRVPDQWTGDGVQIGRGDSQTVDLSADNSFTVVLDTSGAMPPGPVTTALTVTTGSGGRTNWADGVHTFTPDKMSFTSIPITVIPDEGYDYVQPWKIDEVDVWGPENWVNMNSDHSVEVGFVAVVVPPPPPLPIPGDYKEDAGAWRGVTIYEWFSGDGSPLGLFEATLEGSTVQRSTKDEIIEWIDMVLGPVDLPPDGEPSVPVPGDGLVGTVNRYIGLMGGVVGLAAAVAAWELANPKLVKKK